jgi:Fe-S-cluster containining protein
VFETGILAFVTDGNAPRETELSRLCLSCGLCCDGSLFGRVDLRPEEVQSARRRGLRLLRGDESFEQPCSAFQARSGESRRCSIYDDRPHACRTFTCRLYGRHEREGGDIEARLGAVRRVRELVRTLEALRLDPRDFEGDRVRVRALGADASIASSAYAELVRSLEQDFARDGTT